MNRRKLMAMSILALIIIAGGALFYFKRAASTQPASVPQAAPGSQQDTAATGKKKGATIIYADVQKDESDEHEPLQKMDFYSVGQDGSGNAKLFTLSAEQLGAGSAEDLDLGFCAPARKIFLWNGSSGNEEIDLQGKVRNLDFMNVATIPEAEAEAMGAAFSPDCKRIVWSTAVFGATNANQITVAGADGSDRKLVYSSKQEEGNRIKRVLGWSQQDPQKVYLTDYSWDRNGGGGGLYTLDLASGRIERIASVPQDSTVYDVAADGKRVVYGPNPITDHDGKNTTVLDLSSGEKLTFADGSNGKKMFSPAGTQLADAIPVCSGEGGEASCSSDLYLFAGGKNQELGRGIDLGGWLAEDRILGIGTDSLVSVAVGGAEQKIASSSGKGSSLIFVGKEDMQ